MKFWLYLIILGTSNIAFGAKLVSSFEDLIKDLPQQDEIISEISIGRQVLFTDTVYRNGQTYSINNKVLQQLGIQNPCDDYPCENSLIDITKIKDISFIFNYSSLRLKIESHSRKLPLLERLKREKLIAKVKKRDGLETNTDITNTKKKVKITNRIQYSNQPNNNFNQTTLETNVDDFNIYYDNKFLFDEDEEDDNVVRDTLRINKMFGDNEIQIGDYSSGIDSLIRERMENPRGAIVKINQNQPRNFYSIKKYKINIPANYDVSIYSNSELVATYKSQSVDRTIFEEIPLKNGINFIDFRYFGAFGETYEKNIIEKNLRPMDDSKINGKIGFSKERNPRYKDDQYSNDFAEINLPYKNVQVTLGNNRFQLDGENFNFNYQKFSFFYNNLDYELLRSEKTTNYEEKAELIQHKFNYVFSSGFGLNGHYIKTSNDYTADFFINRDEETFVNLRYKNHRLFYTNYRNEGEDTVKLITLMNRFNFKYVRVSNLLNNDLIRDGFNGELRILPFKFLQYTYFYNEDEFFWKDWRINYSVDLTEKMRVRLGYINIVNPFKQEQVTASTIYDSGKYQLEAYYRSDLKDEHVVRVSLTFGFEGNSENQRFSTNPIIEREDLLIVKSFQDNNHNNKRDIGEPFLRDIGFSIDSNKTMLTDEKGEVRQRVYSTVVSQPTTVKMVIPPNNIYLKKEKDIIITKLKLNSDNVLYVPFKPYGEIYGNLDKKLLTDIESVVIRNLNDNSIQKVTPDSDGFFMDVNKKPGRYQLEYKNIKKIIEIPLGGGSVDTKISQI